MSCGVGHRCSLNPVLLWLWPEVVVPILPLAWEPPYAPSAVLERQKKRKEKSSSSLHHDSLDSLKNPLVAHIFISLW